MGRRKEDEKMDFEYYQRKLNDVIVKCPIETGVEILVYRLLEENMDWKQYSLVDINRIWKNQDSRLSTESGIPDIAILSPDFRFKEEEMGRVYGFVEVKAAGVGLGTTDQILGQMKKAPHFIYTNGIVWQYYLKQQRVWEVNLGTNPLPYSLAEISLDAENFAKLQDRLSKIRWEES